MSTVSETIQNKYYKDWKTLIPRALAESVEILIGNGY